MEPLYPLVVEGSNSNCPVFASNDFGGSFRASSDPGKRKANSREVLILTGNLDFGLVIVF